MGRNCIAIVKDQETYIFMYDHDSVPALLQTLDALAADPVTNFSPLDASVASRSVLRLQRVSPSS